MTLDINDNDLLGNQRRDLKLRFDWPQFKLQDPIGRNNSSERKSCNLIHFWFVYGLRFPFNQFDVRVSSESVLGFPFF